jgi:hypothetical protein
MTLTLNKADASMLCHGFDWVVADEDVLAEHVARLAVGQFRHVAKILHGDIAPAGKAYPEAKINAIKLLTLQPKKNGKGLEEPWHRDGWLFQAISWIAAHTAGGLVVRPPHPIRAHKGFDGLQLEFNDLGGVEAVIIFEDKATENPRKMIRDEVLPDFIAMESGDRLNELSQEVAGLLETQQAAHPGLDVDTAVEKIIWKQARHYRIAVTVDSPHDGDVERRALFKDYETSVCGNDDRRGAETMTIPNLRVWMQSFADLAITKIKALPDHV